MDLRKNVAAIFPLTPLQQGLLFHTEAESNGAYVVQTAYQLKGQLNQAKFRQAWELTIARHPVLRSVFGGLTTAKPVQIILKELGPSWSAYDWTAFSEEERQKRFIALTNAEKNTGFAVSRPPLMRFYWLQMAADEVRFVWTYHHALLDGWSVPIVLSDVINCYKALCQNHPPELPTPVDYKQYITWLKSQDSSAASQYWKGQFGDFDKPNQIKLTPPDKPNSHDEAIKEIEQRLSAEATSRLKLFYQQQRITLNLLCQAAFAVLMHRYTNTDDIVFGTIVSGRPANLADIDSLVGNFINTVPVRASVSQGTSVSTLISTLKQQQIARDVHSFLPLREIQQLSCIENGESMFNSLFVFENFPVDPDVKQSIAGLEINRVLVEDKTSYGLVMAAKVSDTLVINTQFKTTDFRPQDIANLTENYLLILEQVAEQYHNTVADMHCMTPHQLNRVIAFGAGPISEQTIEPVISRFERMASLYPDHQALTDNLESVTFRELNHKASQLAEWLSLQNIGAGNKVALCLPSGIDFVISMLAVLKVQACYVPIDLNQPEERIHTLLRNTKVDLVICNTPLDWPATFDWSNQSSLLAEQAFESRLMSSIDPSSSAYIMFTSGTTGEPKTIPIRHNSVANHIDDAIKRYGLSSNDRVLQFASPGFDISIEEMWSSLCSGACLVFFDRTDLAIQTFETFIAKEKITLVDLPTAYWHTWVGSGIDTNKLASLKTLIVGGEAAQAQALQQWRDKLPNVAWFNTYGPTETTVVASVWQAPKALEHTGVIPIGRPIQNVKCLVLDDDQRETPVGVIGELCIGGLGLTPGYFERPDLDEKVFFYKAVDGRRTRFYRTGDLAYWNCDGDLVYQGRRDTQVKLRGYRVELSAVENELCQCEGVTQAHVRTHNHKNQLVLSAYVTTIDDNRYLSRDILRELRLKLPGYMVPTSLTVLDAMPLNNNGKIDAHKLPAPTLLDNIDLPVLPFTDTQKQLAKHWQSTLGIDQPSIHTNFFELGGNSIHAIQIVSLSKQDGLDVQIKELFESPTIAQLAALIESRDETTLVDPTDYDTRVGENALSAWHSWSTSQQILDCSKPQLLLVPIDKSWSQQDVLETMQVIISEHDFMRAQWTENSREVTQRITPWNETTSYSQVPISSSISSQILDQVQLAEAAIIERYGTHALHFKCNDDKRDQLGLLMYGVNLDEHSLALLQQQICYAFNPTPSASMPRVNSTNQQDRLLKAIKNDQFQQQTLAWESWQQASKLFCSSEKHQQPIHSETVLSKTILNDICARFYISLEEVLTYLVTKALAQHWPNYSATSYLLSSTRENAFWQQQLESFIGDFRVLMPAQFNLDESAQATNIIGFKQQYRQVMSQALHYLSAQQSQAISAPVLPNSVLVCTSDLGRGLSFLGKVEQQWNAVAEPSLPNGAGINVRFMETEDNIHVIWQLHNIETSQYDADTLSGDTLTQLKTLQNESDSSIALPILPSDFESCPLDEVAIETLWHDLQSAHNNTPISAIYPLTPLQRGMFFHSTSEAKGAYLVQSAWEIEGPLETRKMQRAWQATLNTHSVLRSVFWGTETETPAQVVLERATIDWWEEDWVGIDNSECQRRLSELLDAERTLAFKPYQSPPMRIYCIQTGQDRFQIVWTYHHALLDGWSVPIVLRDVLKQYTALIKQDRPLTITSADYQPFANWLANTCFKSAHLFWQAELANFNAPNNLRLTSETNGSVKTKEVHTLLGQELWSRLNRFSQQNHVTLNHTCQAAWAILLSQYSGDQDVVFGTTVSGRPAEVQGINVLVGSFINTVPVRMKLGSMESPAQLLSYVREQQTSREQHSYLPLWELQRYAGITSGAPLFESLLVFENYPVDPNLAHSVSDLTITPSSAHGDSNYPLTLVLVPGETLTIRLRYRRISEECAQKIVDDFSSILHQLCQPKCELSSLHLPVKQEQPLTSCLTAKPTPDCSLTVPEAFQRTVAKYPQRTAIIAGEQRLTYGALDKRANSLATLLQQHGIGRHDVVALFLPRGVDAIVGLLAIQKLAAVYLPLDLLAPRERLEHMLSISDAKLILTNSRAHLNVSFAGKNILLDDNEVLDYLSAEHHFRDSVASIDDPAYINFTSGTQGEPKGVVIPHKAIPRLVCDPNYIQLNKTTNMLHASSLAFDACTFEIWGTLLNGGCLVCFTDKHMDLTTLNQLIEQHDINTMWLTAGLFTKWVESLATTLISAPKFIVTGGDVVSPFAVKKLYEHCQHTCVINGYGPTESTTFACCNPIPRDHDWQSPIPIGYPINSTQISIVDESLNPVPYGHEGELVISGEGLALRYLQDANKTAEKFVTIDGKVSYRTGDRAAVTGRGVEFLGRLDRQVKIRGFRVELTEIESVLRQLRIKDCVVVAQGEDASSKKLYAFIEKYDSDLTEENIFNHIKSVLPNYMLPAKVQFIDALPLTPNGKVDHSQLPSMHDDNKQTLPANLNNQTTLSKLTTIWADLLGVKTAELSPESQFFEMGGDSIVAIQLVSQASTVGMKLSVEQIFSNPCLKDMAAAATFEVAKQTFESRYHGPLPLTPIQHWFFEHFSDYPDHWNQGLLLKIPKNACLKSLQMAITSLAQQHDMLRAKFKMVDGEWQQFVSPWTPDYQLEQTSLVDENTWQNALEQRCEQAQKAIKIGTGDLLKVVHFDSPKTEASNRLFIVCHHLVIDGVSWRILLSDLMRAWQDHSACDNGINGVNLKRTHSYKQWLSALHARLPEFEQQLDFWQQQAQPLASELSFSDNVPNLINDERKVECALSLSETKTLLQETHNAYNTSVEHCLLAAILMALSEWSDCENIRVSVEGHGRDGHAGELDLSNTLGWFTAIYPVKFESVQISELVKTLKMTKQCMQAIPEGGVGYSALKYLSEDTIKQLLSPLQSPSVSFNYMGQVRVEENSEVAIAHESIGLSNDPRQIRPHVLAFAGIIEQEQLKLHLHFSNKLHEEHDMRGLLDSAFSYLREIISHCASNHNAGATPSDFPEYPNLQQDALDRIWQHAKNTPHHGGIEAIGLLTGPQQGMLYHSQSNTDEALYVEQMSYDISGHFDVERLRRAWQHIVDKHDIFRVEFLELDTSSPYQVIREKAQIDWQQSDLFDLDGSEVDNTIESLLHKDRTQAFDFHNAPLMRLRVCRISTTSAVLSWTYHHALMDGWSMPILFKSLFDAYLLDTSEAPQPAPSFRRQLEWLGRQDKDAAKQYWRSTLKGFTSPTPLVVKKAVPDQNRLGVGELSHNLTQQVHHDLQNLCKKNGVTLNSICQLAWASLLARYSGEQEIVFAITSSGRSGEIKGINDIVGPFINTLPVKISISKQLSLDEMLTQVHIKQADLDKHGHLPLTEIHDQSGVPKGVDLFESIFAFENYPIDDVVKQRQLPFDLMPREWTSQTNFPLTVIWAPGESLSVKVQFSHQQFEQVTIERLVHHYMEILSGFAKGQHPLDVNILSNDEKQQLLSWNDTTASFDYQHCIHHLIAAQAQKTPNATALYFGNECMSYDELDRLSTTLACHLQSHNLVQVNSLVGVCLPRGFGQVIACLGIMKAGAAYLPLDINWPTERRKKLLIQGNATAIVSTQEVSAELSANIPCVDLERMSINNNGLPLADIAKPNDLAYVIFTSGSTGEPKGVMIEHQSAVNTFIDINNRFDVGAEDRVLAVSSLTFDLSVYDLFGVLCRGGAAVLPDANEATNVQSWCRLVARHKVTIWDSVPQLMSILCEEAEAVEEVDISSITTVMMSGDWIPLDLPERIKKQLPTASINSLGGATEGAIWSITYPIKQANPNWRSVPYGKPMANQAFYILDDNDLPCPIGVPGHLYIAGAGVARGYWKDAERTARQFRPHPKSGESIYWTGDLARYGSDGNIEFLGRSDFQVKINGFRIELGEIESVLNQIDSVKRSVVIDWADESNNRSLIAYVIADASEFKPAQYLQHVQVNLPRYMVPVAVIRIDELPLSSNGKVDRKLLPAPTPEQLTHNYVAPVTPTEQTISDSWQTLLKQQQVGKTDNFFELGGHSLLATQMVSRLARLLHIEIPLEMVFRFPTVESLASAIDSLLSERQVEDYEEGEL